ncbi:glycoside hydrolase domain-containing protein [Bacteroides heparinolyticus]|uniref:glycoside hydrolase domain-containing protein n=1 Tax=Prevotella heparinolytica TaxID=28113 RepID=UPI0035A067D4
MDLRVQEVQLWLGETYPQYFYYDEDGNASGSYPIKPDGITGNTTVKALIMALQIHKQLIPIDGIWGNTTSNAYPVVNRNTTDTTVVKILQGAFLCKGYNPGPFDGIFGNATADAVKKFKNNLGMSGDENLSAEYFKSLLTTDATVLLFSGNAKIRLVQQYLNGKYYSLFKNKLSFLPTGGIFERKTSKALIYAIQKEVGVTSDGVLGPATFSALPNLEIGCSNQSHVKILQAALICNGYNANFDGVYDSALSAIIESFQKFMCLNIDPMVTLGKINRRTWGALLWSKGDIERTPNACDCRTKILNSDLAVALFNQGFRFIGRYLTNVEPNGYDKKMSREEVSILLDAGLNIFPIFQESPHSPVRPTDFNRVRGESDAERAIEAALSLGFEENTILYFALDCDMTEEDIADYAVPYFAGIKSVFVKHLNYYKIGVYGSRNSCQTICDNKYAVSSFVSDMSTGYSGNLGYLLPANWAFEQFVEKKKYSLANHIFDLDYDMASGKDNGVTTLDLAFDKSNYHPPYIPTAEEIADLKSILELIPAIHWLEETYYSSHGITNPDVIQAQTCFMAVLDFLYQYQYNEYKWEFISPKDDEFINLINTRYSENQYYKELLPYIYATEVGEGNDKISTRAKLVTDGNLGIFELPHLAVVIKCYINSLAPGSWSAWAGDFATAVMEVYANCGSNSEAYIALSSEKIGAMEDDVVTVTQALQFNYCDLIADIDGYKIQKLIENSSGMYSLSECIEEYYCNSNMHKKRYQYFKSILKFDDWNVISIKTEILKEFNLILKRFFAPQADDFPYSKDAAAIVLAMNIIYWAKYTSVI